MTRRSLPVLLALLTATACSNTATTTTSESTPPGELPAILAVNQPGDEAATFELYELAVELEAEYDNPFDQREVALDSLFVGPDGRQMKVPGFWDGRASWKLRFAAPVAGDWTYEVTVTDSRGVSAPQAGSFVAVDSQHRGYLYPGSWVDPELSARYFVYSDGSPWYGRGHADLRMNFGGLTEDGFVKMGEMLEIGENFEMWWPLWTYNFLTETYDRYDPLRMDMIDLIIGEAEKHDIALAYTVWQHQFLRTEAHPWKNHLWAQNGFRKLVTIQGFFVDPEAWAWQENYYRYTIARWAYSRSIVMWQTMTEINGSEAYEQSNPWHQKLNAYFQDHDPWRHPTSAVGSGGYDWPEAHAVMDAPQMHVYEEFSEDPIEATHFMTRWTRIMWEREEKPNWIGEWGIRGQQNYPEALHNSLWGTLGAGAAITPIEWNDGFGYAQFDQPMRDAMARFSEFIEGVPMAAYNPEIVDLAFSIPEVRGWGVVGTGGVIWIQDFAQEGKPVREQKADETVRSGVIVLVEGLASGTWNISPYNTWTGEWLEPFEVECQLSVACEIPSPDFHRDIAFLVVKN